MVESGEVGRVLSSPSPSPTVAPEVIALITEGMDVKTVVIASSKEKIIYILGGT